MPCDTHSDMQFRDSAGKPHSSVVRVADCQCRVGEFAWRYAEEHRHAIDQHWAAARAARPSYFDGVVLMTSAYRIDPGARQPPCMHVSLFETRFRNYLFWRHQGFPGEGAIDAFGSAIIRAADGSILLVRQGPGNVNEGLYYFPSGFIDRSDLGSGGHVDIAASITREAAEETGLSADDLERLPGFIVNRHRVQLSIGIEYQTSLAADALAARIGRFLSAETNPEISDVVLVRTRQDLVGLKLAAHCAQLLDVLL